MLLPPTPVLRALTPAIAQLEAQMGGAAEASSAQSVAIALRLLLAREAESAEAQNARLAGLSAALRPLLDDLSAVSPTAAQLRASLDEFQPGRNAVPAMMSEQAWSALLSRVEAWVSESDPGRSSQWSQRLAAALTEWEAADLAGQLGSETAASTLDVSLNAAKLELYLRDRFSDSTIQVSNFRHLPGGFGKQTDMFEAEGRTLSGGFVLRRDLLETVIDNDCHRIELEYELIRAVHARGFPAPEALWLDLHHPLLPGGHFLVMRRAPGIPGGSVFNARGLVPADLSETLARILARLHSLPPMSELKRLTDSVNSLRWSLPLDECVRQYLEQWWNLYRRDAHLPSPAVAALFKWLLGNIPRAAAGAVLLHGDIGFHNFLFDGARLSAVLDWEFAHLGDPAEDLAYVRNTLGPAIDFPQFLAAYRAAGGGEVSPERIRFYQVWGHLRNAASSSLFAGKFAQGRITDLKIVVLPHVYIPQFLRAAQAAIDSDLTGIA